MRCEDKLDAVNLDMTDPSIKPFLAELVSALVKKFRDEIVSIALFGSGATKDWIKGKSDVDFIVVIRDGKKKSHVEYSTNRILVELDKKYNLNLIDTCSTFVKHKNPLVNSLYRLEDLLTFGKPFFVFSLDQMNFENATILDPRIRFVSLIFDPLTIFLAKMKQTGITIYGNNLIEKICYNATPIEKIRIAIAPLWIIIMSLISFPLDEHFALKHSVKATLWACEDSLFALGFPLSNTKNEVELINSIFGRINDEHLKQTLSLKFNTYKKKFVTKGFVAKYILNTIWFIHRLYYRTALFSRKPNK